MWWFTKCLWACNLPSTKDTATPSAAVPPHCQSHRPTPCSILLLCRLFFLGYLSITALLHILSRPALSFTNHAVSLCRLWPICNGPRSFHTPIAVACLLEILLGGMGWDYIKGDHHHISHPHSTIQLLSESGVPVNASSSTMMDCTPSNIATLHNSTDDLPTILFILDSCLSAAARVFSSGCGLDLVYLINTIVRLCLEVPSIHTLPIDQRCDVICAITCYMIVSVLLRHLNCMLTYTGYSFFQYPALKPPHQLSRLCQQQ